MRFKNTEDQQKELWFNDVFIYQNYSDIPSRKECSVNNWILKDVTLPIIAANMNAVSWKRMCETLSRYW
jgi:IMP dehydrogenase/GMP reductase